MNRTKCLIMASTLCVLLAMSPEAESDEDPGDEEETAVTISLTKLDVNDTNLKLSWKIKNDTDHDVWVCDRYSMDFEQFMDKDAKTLVLRRRYNLSNEGVLWEFPFPRFRYSRLRPDQEKVESLSLTVPVRPWTLFSSSRGNAESAKRLAIEIGFYDEDLPELILNIVEMAEKLSCDTSLYSPASPPMDSNDNSMEFSRRFFGGVFIARFFNSENFTYFRNSVTSGGDEIITPYLWQTLNGEQILRIKVDGVSIPYKGYIPLTSHAGNKTKDVQSQQRISRNKEKPNPEKASDRNDTHIS